MHLSPVSRHGRVSYSACCYVQLTALFAKRASDRLMMFTVLHAHLDTIFSLQSHLEFRPPREMAFSEQKKKYLLEKMIGKAI